MSDEAKKAFAARTACRKDFNALVKQIQNAIKTKDPVELVEEQLNDLKEARKQLKERHSAYLVLSLTDEDDAEKDYEYIDIPTKIC